MLCTVGSRCFPYLGEYRKNKLKPKSLFNVFIGYNNKYKGYNCFYPSIGCVYTSKHVVFDESMLSYCTFANIYSNFVVKGKLSV